MGVTGKVFTTDTITATANIDAPWFIGNVLGNITGNVTITGNISAPGSNKQVIFNDSGNANASSNFTFDKVTNVLSIVGNISTGNLSTGSTGLLAVGKLTTISNATIGTDLNVTANTKTGNLEVTTVANITTLGVTNSNIATIGITQAYVATANIVTLGVSSSANITTAGIGQEYVGTSNITTAGITNGNIGTIGITQEYVTTSNITTAGITTANIVKLDVSTQANIQLLGVTGKVFTTDTITATGNIDAPWFIGNVVGNITGNLTAPGTNKEVIFNDNTIAGASSGLTFDKSTGLLTTTSLTLNASGPGVLTTTNITTGNPSTGGTITGDWSLTAGSRLTATYADLAEYYEADKPYEPGTVLQFGGDKEVTIAEDGTNKVAGVVSTDPAYVMNMKCPGQYVVALALQGRVPVKVRGTIHKGDMLIAAGNGYARPTDNPYMGTVIGKALENFTDIEGVIEVAVGRL